MIQGYTKKSERARSEMQSKLESAPQNSHSTRMFSQTPWICRFVVLCFVLRASEASVRCKTNRQCEVAYRTGSECIDKVCTNPFQKGGCLKNVLPQWKKLRVCHSEDPPDAATKGYCRPASEGLDYMEIRILAQNWESPFFQTWLLQILLSEMLDVPVTVETGSLENRLDFYAEDMPFDYGVGYSFDAMRLANQVNDCRSVAVSETWSDNDNENRRLRRSEGPEYKPCAHVTPEVWQGSAETLRNLESEGVIEPPQGMGALGHLSWFIPKFTGERDLTLFSYLGLQGEQNRQKLAEMFKRPTSWKEYCDLVSADGCETPDDVAIRAPGEGDETRMYVDGVYKGHFRKTEQNDCDKNPDTCTGHIVDFPCGWTSYVKQQTHHLRIALESNGPEPISGGYSYSQMSEIWAAANATRSDVMMLWWTPEALYQQYLGTEAEFQRINLPPPSQTCVEARVTPTERCEAPTLEQRIGDSDGSCDYSPVPLHRVVTNNLYTMSYGPDVIAGEQSPAYDAIKAFTFTGLQIGEIFERWIGRGEDKWNYDPREAVCTWAADNVELLQSMIPRTFPRTIETTDSKGPLFFVSISVAAIASFIVLFCIVGTYLNRKKKSLVFAQVEFLWILLTGLLMVTIGSIVLPLEPTDTSCVASVWLVNLGYTLEIVPLIVKVAAINRIMMAASRMKRVVLKHSTLFGIVVLLTSVAAIYLFLWTFIDTPHQSTEFSLTDTVTDEGETIVVATNYCSSESALWKYVSTGCRTVLLVCATVLAFQTRKIQHDVNESQVLAILIYSHFVFVVLQIILFTLEDLLDVSDLSRYQSLVYSCDAIAACCIYFLPKFAAKDSHYTQRRSTFVSGHSTSNLENPMRRSYASGLSSELMMGSSNHQHRQQPMSSMVRQAIVELSEEGCDSDSSCSSSDTSFAVKDDEAKAVPPEVSPPLECHPNRTNPAADGVELPSTEVVNESSVVVKPAMADPQPSGREDEEQPEATNVNYFI